MYTQEDIDRAMVMTTQYNFSYLDHMPMTRWMMGDDPELREQFYSAWKEEISSALLVGEYQTIMKISRAMNSQDHEEIKTREPGLLHHAVLQKAPAPVIYAVLKMNYDLTTLHKGHTALQIAIIQGQTTVVKLIIREQKLRDAAEK